jgi:competence protein ComEC
MRDSGLAHLLSVSGLHIAIVMGLAFAVARLGLALVPWVALRLPGKLLAGVAALAVGGFYMLLTGSAVPMQRSFGMAALTTLALLTGRRAITLRGWALAAAAVMLLQPEAVTGPSFQMSFAAVLALISGWEWLRPRLNAMAPEHGWRRKAVLAAFGLVATSLLAGAATTPFGLHHFGRLQLFGVAANAVAVPLTSALVMPAGMAAVALMPFGLEGLALAPMQWGVEATLWVARCVAAWPGASLVARPLPAWGLGLVSFGMLWLCLWRSNWRVWGLPLIGLGLLSGSLARPPDLLVSDDARMIAVRTNAGVLWQRQSGGNALTREMWLRLWGETDGQTLPREGGAGGVACLPGACVLHAAPEVVLLRGDAPGAACGRAALVISAEPVRGRCRAPVVDRFSVWRNGAHAVWLGRDGVTVLSDRGYRGDRPWVPPVPRPRGAAEPLAPTE